MSKETLKSAFTIPNILSYFRILLVPVFVLLYVNSDCNIKLHLAAAGVLALSGITDMLDGKIARKFNQITELGKVLDPLADKLTQAAIVGCLATLYPLFFIVLAILVVKEITMGSLALYYLKKGRKLNGAHWYGKVATTVFYIITVLLLLIPKIYMNEIVANILIVITGAFMLFAFVMYLRVYRMMGRDSKEGNPIKRY